LLDKALRLATAGLCFRKIGTAPRETPMPAKKDVPRLQPTGPEDLRDYARRLRAVAASITALAKMLEESDLEKADVEGHKSVELAFDALNKFVANCEKKIREF
jgi:hypothetical protein